MGRGDPPLRLGVDLAEAFRSDPVGCVWIAGVGAERRAHASPGAGFQAVPWPPRPVGVRDHPSLQPGRRPLPASRFPHLGHIMRALRAEICLEISV